MVPRIYPIAKETDFDKIIIPGKMVSYYQVSQSVLGALKRKTKE